MFLLAFFMLACETEIVQMNRLGAGMSESEINDQIAVLEAEMSRAWRRAHFPPPPPDPDLELFLARQSLDQDQRVAITDGWFWRRRQRQRVAAAAAAVVAAAAAVAAETPARRDYRMQMQRERAAARAEAERLERKIKKLRDQRDAEPPGAMVGDAEQLRARIADVTDQTREACQAAGLIGAEILIERVPADEISDFEQRHGSSHLFGIEGLGEPGEMLGVVVKNARGMVERSIFNRLSTVHLPSE